MGVGYNPKISTSELLLCLDAANPKSYPGSGNTWFDISGRGNHFSLNGNTIPTVTDGRSLSFNGIDQYGYISSPVSTDLFLNAGQGPRTIEIWAKVNTLPDATDSIGGLFGDQYSTSGILVVFNNGQIQFRMDDGGTSASKIITAGEWFQFVVLLETPYLITYYVNGALDTAQFTNPDTNSNSNSAWAIGRQNRTFAAPNPLRYLNCNVSIIRNYNTVLTATEIRQNFNANRSRFGI